MKKKYLLKVEYSNKIGFDAKSNKKPQQCKSQRSTPEKNVQQKIPRIRKMERERERSMFFL